MNKYLIVISLLLLGACANKSKNRANHKQEVLKVLQADAKNYSECYMKHCKGPSCFKYTALVNFKIDQTGNVHKTNVKRISKKKTKYAKKINYCMLKAVKKLKFPGHKSDEWIEVNQPFNFKMNVKE